MVWRTRAAPMASCISAPGVDASSIERAASASGPRPCCRATSATACARAARRCCDLSDKRQLASRNEPVGGKDATLVRVHPRDPDLQLVADRVAQHRTGQDGVQARYVQPRPTLGQAGDDAAYGP